MVKNELRYMLNPISILRRQILIRKMREPLLVLFKLNIWEMWDLVLQVAEQAGGIALTERAKC